MKVVASLPLFLAVSSASAQLGHYQGYCTSGATKGVTAGMQTSNSVQSVFPNCTVKVYQTGTTTLAPIFSDTSATILSNPITASTSGFYSFYANASVDIVMSGTGMQTTTLSNVVLGGGGGSSGGGGSIPAGTVGQPQIQAGGVLGAQPNTTTNATGGVVQSVTTNNGPATANPLLELNSYTHTLGSIGTEQVGSFTEQRVFSYHPQFFGRGFNLGGPWSVTKEFYLEQYKYQSGISQGWSVFQFCLSTGDCAPWYAYLKCHAGSPDSSAEGCEAHASQVFFSGGYAGTVGSSTSSAPTSLTLNETNGEGPGQGMYLLRWAGAQTAYAASTTPNTAGSGGTHGWTQYVTLTTSPAANAGAYSVPGGTSTAHGVVATISDDLGYSTPHPRTATVRLDPALGAFQNGQLLCIGGAYTDTAVAASVSVQAPVSSGGITTQSISFSSSDRLYGNPELWQGGPCGMVLGELNGRSQQAALASHDITALPIVGSPAPGVIALSTAFTGGQQGPGYGYGKRDFNAGIDPSNGADDITMVKPTDGSGAAAYLTSQFDLSSLLLPYPDTQAYPSTVVASLVSSTPAWNGSIYHAFDSGHPFLRTANAGLGPNFASNTQFQVLYGNFPSGVTAKGHVEVRGFDTVLIASAAKIAAVNQPVSGSTAFPLELAPNALPALAAGETLDVANYFREIGRAIRTVSWHQNQNAYNPLRGDVLNADFSCQHIGECVRFSAGLNAAYPIGTVLNLVGDFNNGISMNQPIQSAFSTAIPDALRVQCYTSNTRSCNTSPSAVYHGFHWYGLNNDGVYDTFNTQSGEYGVSNAFMGNGPVWAMAPGGNANPFTEQNYVQTLATNHSQSLIARFAWNSPAYHFTDPLYKSVLATGFEYIPNFYGDTVGRIVGGAVNDRTGINGLGGGRLDMASFNSTSASTFNVVTSGAQPPVPADTTVAGHTDFTVTPSAGCTQAQSVSDPTHCTYYAYKFSALTALGESALPSDQQFVRNGQAAPLGASSKNTVTVANYAQQPGVTGYAVYYSSQTVSNQYLGDLAFGASIVHDGTQAPVNPRGNASVSDVGMSEPLYGAQVRLKGHGVRWQTNSQLNGPSDTGITRTAAGIVSVDGAAENDGLGTLKAASLQPANGWTGTFKSGDTSPLTCTVTKGIITNCQ